MTIFKVPHESGKMMRIPRSFMQKSKLDGSLFRVLCNGLSHPTGWSVKVCAKETGYSERTVTRLLKALLALGYARKQPAPLKKKKFGFRFQTIPSLPDEKRPWYNEMMRENEGDISGIAFPALVDDGKWRYED